MYIFCTIIFNAISLDNITIQRNVTHVNEQPTMVLLNDSPVCTPGQRSLLYTEHDLIHIGLNVRRQRAFTVNTVLSCTIRDLPA